MINTSNQSYQLRRSRINYNYDEDKERLIGFFKFFIENEEKEPKYIEQLRKDRQVVLEIEDLIDYGLEDIAQRFVKNTKTYVGLGHKALDEVIYDSDLVENFTREVFTRQRVERFKAKYAEASIAEFLGFLIRSYTLSVSSSTLPTSELRKIKADRIGHLVSVEGVCTKVSMVRPSVRVLTYLCETCGTETYSEVATSSEVFSMLEQCSSEKCEKRKVKGTLRLVTRACRFQRFQTIQIQEVQSEVPSGCIPRRLRIECTEHAIDSCRPGDQVRIVGIFMPRMYYGYKKMRAGLLNETFIEAHRIEVISSQIEERNKIELRNNLNFANNLNFDWKSLIDFFAPEIYGLRDVKKILLLTLVSSPELVRSDGIKIRGDLNVLLLGDPGIAKSQLLKRVTRLSRRGVYTTGMGSTGVGLTACVTKDPVTGEIVLEGGALVLADGGVCCIDELDKMSDDDRVSVHEAMEQHSISVSKAGINTTLNARCSVLAAANPIRGNFDLKKSLEYNTGLPVSLISRFDAILVLKDEATFNEDLELARHVTSLSSVDFSPSWPPFDFHTYLDYCKTLSPVFRPGLKDKLVTSYIQARKDRVITPRYLLSLIRFSIAHARMRLAEFVEEEDVDEAIRLLGSSVSDASHADHVVPDNRKSLKHSIYNFIRNFCESLGGAAEVDEILRNCDFDKKDVLAVISEFEESGVFIVEDSEKVENGKRVEIV